MSRTVPWYLLHPGRDPVTVIRPPPWLSNVTSPIFDLTIQLKDQLSSEGYICSLALALSAKINHHSTGEKLRAIIWHPPALALSLSPPRQPYWCMTPNCGFIRHNKSIRARLWCRRRIEGWVQHIHLSKSSLWSNLCTSRNVWNLPLLVLQLVCWNSTTQRVSCITHDRSIVLLHYTNPQLRHSCFLWFWAIWQNSNYASFSLPIRIVNSITEDVPTPYTLLRVAGLLLANMLQLWDR